MARPIPFSRFVRVEFVGLSRPARAPILRVYAHAMRDEESDLSFADFESEGVAAQPGIAGKRASSGTPVAFATIESMV